MAASIRLSSGRWVVAGGVPLGAAPFTGLILLSVISVYIRKELSRQWSSQTFYPSSFTLSFPSSARNVSLPNSPFVSIPTPPFSFFSTPSMLPPYLTRSSGEGLTRPRESSESYIWGLITLPWRLPVCRAQSERQGEEEDGVSREYEWGRGFASITLHTAPHHSEALSQQI